MHDNDQQNLSKIIMWYRSVHKPKSLQMSDDSNIPVY